ncbi:MAG: gamma-glutamyl-gamma-aminobutyrate hydrolase family protein [Planctomycetota bacterium]
MRAPLIAVNGIYRADDPMLTLRQRYPDAVRRAGGVPVAVPPIVAEPNADGSALRDAEVESLLARVDGLLLTGGDDFITEELGLGPTHPSAERTPLAKQRYDLALARAALDRDVPVLGICYGMQCLALVDGATMWQDLPSQRPGALAHADSAIHPVRPKTGTKLGSVTGLEPFPVVSRHHQALRTVPPPWIVSAVDEEGLVEAIERPDRRFAIGVQWHPELSPGEAPQEALLAALVEAAHPAPSTNRR